MSALGLKLIAFAAMLIDHLGYSLLNCGILSGNSALYMAMRIVGRIAFPIFVYQMVEGARYTRSKKMYVLRLLVFALIAEVPFDLMRGMWFDAKMQNVMFTLFLGLLCVFAIQWTGMHMKTGEWWRYVLLTAFIGAAAFCGSLLKTDYDYRGVLAVAIAGLPYLPLKALRSHVQDERVISIGFLAAAVFVLSILCGSIEWYAMFALVPIWFYNGRKGYSSRALQYGMYFFYPVHMLLLSGMCALSVR